MFRPVPGWLGEKGRRSGGLALAVVVAVLLADGAASLTFAQKADGWFGRLTNRPPAQSESEAAEAREQAEAARLFGDAQRSVEQGHLQDARNRLEHLLARYPSSHLIDAARRDLRNIYEKLANQLAPQSAPQTAQQASPPTMAISPAKPLQDPQDGFKPAGQTKAAPPGSIAPPVTAEAPSATRRMVPLATNPAAKAIDFLKDEFRNAAGDRIFFTDGSAEFGTRARVGLEAQAIWLRRNPGVSVVVEGHADDSGSRDFNLELSRRRAEATKSKLVELGVEASRIDLLAFGRDRPVSNCEAAACANQNRLVLTTISRVTVAASP